MTSLRVSLGALPVLALKIRDGTLRIGRAAQNDLVLSLPEIAATHALLIIEGDRITIEVSEGESLIVNGRSVTTAHLSDGDEITIGGYQLRLRSDAESADDSDFRGRTTSPIGGDIDTGEGDVTRVIVSMGRDVGRETSMPSSAILAGRAPECDLVLHDETVSWRHARLERIPGAVRVLDLGSRNGTFVNGARIESAQAVAGDRVRLGRTTLLLAGSRGSPGAAVEGGASGLAELVGSSRVMQVVYERIREVARTRVPVLITGETGTGKELAARAIHSLGPRASGPFIPINCAAVPKDLLESELFGYTKGTFTGADRDRSGLLEQAAGGTVFLDEISELPPDLQPKLLRVLEDGEVPRLGGRTVSVDFRILAATNRDLEGERSAGRFRDDLFYRLAVARIDLPPLSDRLEDLSDLVRNFLGRIDREAGIEDLGTVRFEEEAFVPLREYEWPGNVRELRNLIIRAVMRSRGKPVSQELIEALLAESPPGRATIPAGGTLRDVERVAIGNALRDCNGSRRETARRLGIAESTLYEKIRKHGFETIGRDS